MTPERRFFGRRTLVTGGAGFIGTNLTRCLLELGGSVVILDDLSNGLNSNLQEFGEAEIIRGDIRDLELVRRAIDGCSHVVHLAALGSVPRSLDQPVASYEVNVVGSLHVFEAARLAGVERVVYASSSSVYGNTEDELKREGLEGTPISPYAASKAAMELLARTHAVSYGVPILGLRFFNVFGPSQRADSAYAAVIPLFTAALLNGGTAQIFGDGEQVRDFTYVDDVVQAILLALSADVDLDGSALNVSSGIGSSVNSVFARVAAATGRGDIKPEFHPGRLGDIRRSRADITRAQVQLGFEPSWSIDEGLKRYVDWYLEHATN